MYAVQSTNLLCIVQCTLCLSSAKIFYVLYSVRCTVHKFTMYCTVNAVQSTNLLCIVQCKLYRAHIYYVLYSVRCTVHKFTMYCTVYAVKCTNLQCIVQCTLYIAQIYYVLYSVRCTNHKTMYCTVYAVQITKLCIVQSINYLQSCNRLADCKHKSVLPSQIYSMQCLQSFRAIRQIGLY